MQIELPHGTDRLDLFVPDENLLAVPLPGEMNPAADPEALVQAKLQKAIEAAGLEGKAGKGTQACISVTDRTRSTPLALILPMLLDELNRLGVSDERIKIISGGGMHAADTDSDLRETLGHTIVERVDTLTNEPDNDDIMVRLGETSMGTAVEVHKAYAQAEIKIGVSNVNPCMLAGWSGSAKMVQPAVASRKSIYQNHRHFVRPLMDLKIGSLMGIMPPENPVRADIEECADIAGMDLSICTVLDSERQLVDLLVGDHLEAHRKAVARMKPKVEVSLPESVDILVAAVGDPALEVSLFQGGSRVCGGVDRYLRPGGTLIMVNACEEGIYEGFEHEEYRAWMRQMPAPEEIGNIVESGEMGGEKGCVLFTFSWLLHEMDCEIALVTSGMNPAEIEEIHLLPQESPQSALEAAFVRHGKGATVGVMPYAGLVLPKLKVTHYAS